MNNLVDIIIPTWNNPQYLQGAITTLLQNSGTENLFHIYIVNNGHPNSCDWIGKDNKYVTVLQSGGENLGWEGGLKLGLEASTAPYVCFFNDDAAIPPSSRLWLNQLLAHFKDPKVAAVGPSSNVVMGMQNIFASNVPYTVYPARFLIGFCLLVDREKLMEVGGVDDTLPGGDDLDLSIRFRQAGYKILADRTVFVYHHGFKTGERVHGTADKTGGWNSYEFSERTDFALIKKHGFRNWYECKMGVYQFDEKWIPTNLPQDDIEGDMVREYIIGDKILDLGCGGKKTVENAIGVDMVATDETIETLSGNQKSQADIVADVSQKLPIEDGTIDTIIARHILEHMLDPLEVLENWKQLLKPGGRLILALPDERLRPTIPLNIEHKHAYTPTFTKRLLEATGFKVIEGKDTKNGVSFVIVGEV